MAGGRLPSWSPRRLLRALLRSRAPEAPSGGAEAPASITRDDLTARLKTLSQDEAARWLAEVLPEFIDDRFFDLWESHGFHVTPCSFMSPIPTVSELGADVWESPSTLPGIDLNEAYQLRLLTEEFPRFRAEYEELPTAPGDDPALFFLDNLYFAGTDALVLYCMVRLLEPARILEVGSGFSTQVSARAVVRNGTGRLQCIEPYPSPLLVQGFPGLDRLYTSKVEDMGLDLFRELDAGDVLFIDSSHVARIASDVNFLFLEVLPRLRPGVVVHVHDIYLPFEYRREWIRDDHFFWNEQYMLQAFLQFNSAFEVVFANTYMAHRHGQAMKATFPSSPWWGGGSFWMRRIGG